MGGGEPVQAFTAIGEVLQRDVYQVESNGFEPYRRDVHYFACSRTPIHPLLEKLAFTNGIEASWGQVMRRGFFEISEADFELISAAMLGNPAQPSII